MANELLEKILNSKKIAYKNLNPLIAPYLDRSKEEQNVNIYIDLFDIVKQLYNPQTIDVFNQFKTSDRNAIASEIINIISHYRHFFASRYRKFTTFYFFINTQEGEYQKKLFSDYKKDFYSKRLDINNPTFGNLNKVILKSFKLINIILQYIPHAYFINTKNLESNIVPYYLIQNKSNEDDLNIIISNDILFYQDLLIKENLNNDVFILELRGEKSRIVTIEDIYDNLLEKTKKSYNDFDYLSYENLNIIFPLISHKNYNIPAIKNMGITRAMNFVNKGFEKEINYDNNNDQMIYKNNEILKKLMISFGLTEEEWKKYSLNYSLINHEEILDKNFNNYRNIIELQIIDRVDPNGIRVTNERYFPKNPILLDYAFEGEEYE